MVGVTELESVTSTMSMNRLERVLIFLSCCLSIIYTEINCVVLI